MDLFTAFLPAPVQAGVLPTELHGNVPMENISGSDVNSPPPKPK
jgi:hypothetical protein